MTNRRQFLSLAAPLSALALPSIPAFAAANPAKLLVLVYLKGGNDNYNTLVPFTSAKYYKGRPTIAIKRENTLHLNDSQGLNSMMKAMLPIWEARELAIVQGIGQQEITNQHFRDLEMQLTGAGPEQFFRDGWLTRAFSKDPQPGGLLDCIGFDDMDIRENDPMGPFRGDLHRVIQMQHPSEWLTHQRVAATQHAASTRAKDIAKTFAQRERVSLKAAFPADAFGDALKATVEMAALGIAPPVVHITLNSLDGDQHNAFDTHWDQQKHHGPVLERLATGLSAFRQAMREIGQWDNTLLATYDEFGRCPKESEKQGTHHGWGSIQFVMGGRVKGGFYGEAVPVVDVFWIDGPPPVIDYRALYTTIIEKWWGNSADGIFAKRFKPIDLLKA